MKFWSLVRYLAFVALFTVLAAACGRAELPLYGGSSEGATSNGGSGFSGSSGFGGSIAGTGGGPAKCGNGRCDGKETPNTCPGDCFCGDGVCNGNEPAQ